MICRNFGKILERISKEISETCDKFLLKNYRLNWSVFEVKFEKIFNILLKIK